LDSKKYVAVHEEQFDIELPKCICGEKEKLVSDDMNAIREAMNSDECDDR
jgi:hypothetical protein